MLCASIGLRDPVDALRVLRRLPPQAHFVEIRLDRLDDPSPEPFCQNAVDRLIFTCRRKSDGGEFSGNEAVRLGLLRRARAAGAGFIDLEMDVDDDEAGSGKGIIRSYHDMTGMPSDLAGLIGALQDRRGEVVKLAVTPHRYADALRILTFDRAPRKKIALMAMGPFSLCTRVLSESAGNFLTYCAAAADSPTAPGQPTLDEMLHLYRVPDLGRRPRVFGLLGTGISHSLSPRLHNGWFKRRREPCVYLPFDTKGIDDFLALSLSLPMAGWSVTAPFKLEMARRVDRLAPSARLAGSVNTVIAHGRKLIGYNTDIRALIHLLNETGGNPAFRIRRTTSGIVYRGRVLIIGAGGTAIAVCRALRQHGADVVMTARRLERRNVAQEIGVEFIPWNRRIQADAGVIINATPIGHAGWRGLPYPGSRLFSGHIIIDFPYGDGDTDFVRAGRKAGCRIIDGKRLLLEQARLQRKLFAQAKQAVRLS